MANEFKIKKGLIVSGSGGTLLDVQGSVGQVLSITDSLTGDIFSVSDVSGIPIFNVNSNGTSYFDGNATFAGNITAPGLVYDATNKYLSISHWSSPPTPAAILHLSDNSNDLDVPQIRIEGRENPGDTVLDIAVKDADVRFNLVEGSTDASSGYGKMHFKTNANANSSHPTRGGFLFQTGAGSVIDALTITNEGNATFAGSIGATGGSFTEEVTIADAVDGPFTALRLMNQKTYGSGTGTNEKVRFAMGISESGETFANREGFVIDVGINSESDSSNGVVDFKVRDGGTIGTYQTVNGHDKSVDFAGDVTSTKLISTGGVLDLDDNGDADGVINARASLTLNIDSDANSTGEVFRINSNTTGVNTNNLLSITETGNATFSGNVTANNLSGTNTGDQDLSPYTTTNGTGDEWKFTLGDESSLTGNKWYKVARVNQGSGGLHIKGALSNHVESFGTQKVDLLIQGREANDGDEIEITGTVDVLNNATGTSTDKVGVRVIESDNTTSPHYHYYDVYIRTTRYTQAKFHLVKMGATSFYTAKPSVTSEPAPVSGGTVELDTSTLLEGQHVIVDSVAKLHVAAGGATVTGSITATGDVIAYSDARLKENVKTLDGSKVLQMRGVSFDRKDTGISSSGVIAQEMQKIAPELVSDDDGTLGVAYGNLTGYLIEAIKDLKTEVEQLKKLIKNGNNL